MKYYLFILLAVLLSCSGNNGDFNNYAYTTMVLDKDAIVFEIKLPDTSFIEMEYPDLTFCQVFGNCFYGENTEITVALAYYYYEDFKILEDDQYFKVYTELYTKGDLNSRYKIEKRFNKKSDTTMYQHTYFSFYIENEKYLGYYSQKKFNDKFYTNITITGKESSDFYKMTEEVYNSIKVIKKRKGRPFAGASL